MLLQMVIDEFEWFYNDQSYFRCTPCWYILNTVFPFKFLLKKKSERQFWERVIVHLVGRAS